MYVTPSIFDSATEESKLWRKSHEEFNQKEPTTLTFKAFKKSKKEKNQLDERCFFVIGHFLCYRKKLEGSSFTGILNLKWTAIEFSRLMVENKDINYFGITFIRKLKYCSIFIESRKDFIALKNEIQKYCVLGSFYKCYKPLEIIGSGSFGIVRNIKI